MIKLAQMQALEPGCLVPGDCLIQLFCQMPAVSPGLYACPAVALPFSVHQILSRRPYEMLSRTLKPIRSALQTADV